MPVNRCFITSNDNSVALINLQRCPVDARISDDKQPHWVSAHMQRGEDHSGENRHVEQWECFTGPLTQT